MYFLLQKDYDYNTTKFVNVEKVKYSGTVYH